VLAIVVSVSEHLTGPSAVVGVLSFLIVAGLGWGMFMFGIDAMRAGLERLLARDDSRGIVWTVAFLPYLLVAGVMMLSGAVSLAIAGPPAVLPAASAVSLGGGVILFYGANTMISLRYGTPWRQVAPWTVPSIVLPLIVGAASLVMPAIWSIAAMAATICGIVTLSEVRARARGIPRPV
jgi:low temperature requirement protein LtrA